MADPPNIASASTGPPALPETTTIVSLPANGLQQQPQPSAVQTTYSFMTTACPSTFATASSQPMIIATTSNTVQLVSSNGAAPQNVIVQMPVTFFGRNNIQFLRPSTPILNQNAPRINTIQNIQLPRATVPVIRIPTPVKSIVKEVQPNQTPPGTGIRVIQPARPQGLLQSVPRPVAKPRILANTTPKAFGMKPSAPRLMLAKPVAPRPIVANPSAPKPMSSKPLSKPTFSKPSAAAMAKPISKPVGSKKPFRANTRILKVPTTITPLKKVAPVKPNLPISPIKEPSKFVDIRQCFPIDINRSIRVTPFDWRRYRKEHRGMEEVYKKRHPNETPKVKKPWDKAFQPPMPPPRRRSSPQKPQVKPEPVKAFHLTANLPMNSTIGPLTESNAISPRKKRKSQGNDGTVLKRPKMEVFETNIAPNEKSASAESIRSSGSDSGVETLSQSSTNSAPRAEVFETVITEQARILKEETCSPAASTSTAFLRVEQYKQSLLEANARHDEKVLKSPVLKTPPVARKRPVKVEVKKEVSESLAEAVPTKPQPRGRTYFKRNGVFKPRSKAAEWKTTVSDLNFDNEELVYLHIVYNKFYEEGLLPFMNDPYKQASKAVKHPDCEKAPEPSKSPKSGAAQFFRQRIQMASTPTAYVDEKTRIPERYTDPELADLTPNRSGCARCEPFRRRDNKFMPPDVSSVTEDGRRFIEVTKEDEDNIRQAKESKKNDRRMTRHILTQIANEAPELAKLQIFKSNSLANEKLLKYAKSPIHGYGLFALCAIEPEQIIIEYVGERVRHELADFREKRYESQGMNSSYMFRLDDDYVIDATKMGNLARFINHCCNPNCYARISSRNGKKHILIYSKRYIDKGEELTYDYKFPIEESKIECHCGAKTCRKWLN
uniref:[histone H3]-lysine(4) N-trimethyltransferase n=1 Tax=Panagrellus redivivus TaxID=6233 RepID=A0A7E4VME8_PANRE